jgi:hypothetical protein
MGNSDRAMAARQTRTDEYAQAEAPPEQPQPERMISDENVGNALDWLRDHAKEIGVAKQREVLAGHMVKHVEALETKMSNASSDAKKKIEARTSKRFLEAITEDAIASGELARLTALREAAQAKIECWRTEQSNFRAMNKSF